MRRHSNASWQTSCWEIVSLSAISLFTVRSCPQVRTGAQNSPVQTQVKRECLPTRWINPKSFNIQCHYIPSCWVDLLKQFQLYFLAAKYSNILRLNDQKKLRSKKSLIVFVNITCAVIIYSYQEVRKEITINEHRNLAL